MSINELLEQAHSLNASEKYLLIESLIQDLNQIDKTIEDAWIKECNRRLDSYNEGKLETVSMEKVFFDVQN